MLIEFFQYEGIIENFVQPAFCLLRGLRILRLMTLEPPQHESFDVTPDKQTFGVRLPTSATSWGAQAIMSPRE
jgi:hypothetical protein